MQHIKYTAGSVSDSQQVTYTHRVCSGNDDSEVPKSGVRSDNYCSTVQSCSNRQWVLTCTAGVFMRAELSSPSRSCTDSTAVRATDWAAASMRCQWMSWSSDALKWRYLRT